MNRHAEGSWSRYAQPDIVLRIISRALIDGYRTWIETDATLYDLKENSVTVRLLAFAQDAVRNLGGVTLWFSRDEAVVTAAIRAGLSDPNRGPHPDMIVRMEGLGIVGLVECKWVDRGTRLNQDAKQYVTEGIQRFMPQGEYTGLAPTNLMVGYLLGVQRLPDRVALINCHIDANLDERCRLVHNGPIWGHDHAYQSHAAVDLQHLFFEVPQVTRS